MAVSAGKHGASQSRWIERRGTNYLLLGMYLCLHRGKIQAKIQCASLRGLERVYSESLCSVFCVMWSE